jgi:membrane protease YdiL (CAAX protease family)
MRESLWRRCRPLNSALLILGFYLAATQVAHTLLYTIVAYIVSAADKTGTDFGNTVNEIAGQYYFFSFSLAALLMTFTTWQGDRALYRHDPFWNENHQPVWQLNRLTKEELIRGISSGAIAAFIYLSLFTLSGRGNFLGVYITSTLGTPVFPLFFLDLAALSALLFCEEYIFRHKILRRLLQQFTPGTAVCLTAAAYLAVKYLQFELGWMDYLNLSLMNLALGYFFLKSGKAHRGIGFALVLVLVLHSLAGLPLWDSESPSFFLFKATQRNAEILFGGGAGPFAGLALSSIFVVFALGGAISWKQDLETKRQAARQAKD